MKRSLELRELDCTYKKPFNVKVDVSLALLCKVLKMDYKKHPCVRLFHAFGGKNEVKLHF